MMLPRLTKCSIRAITTVIETPILVLESSKNIIGDHQLRYCQGFRSRLGTARLLSSEDSKKKNKDNDESIFATNKKWSEEWKLLGLGARLPRTADARITNLLFVQTGFGVDQHGDRSSDGATKAATRAIRNAIEFNSIPGVIEAIPGGRSEMLIHVRLGVPPKKETNDHQSCGSWLEPMDVELSQVAKVFPYGRLLPIQVVVGGLKFPTGRIVHELGDKDDLAICVAACVSIGYDNREDQKSNDGRTNSHLNHTTYSTSDGY